MDFTKLAELLFPDVDKTVEYYEELYKERNLPEGARVTRFAPSPTGYLHIGGLFSGLISKLTADVSGGAFYLRIEDTDKKREVEDGVSGIVKGLRDFGIDITEGVTGFNTEAGDYGPYTQSKRADVYHCVAKQLVLSGLAYPCFCTAEEVQAIRDEQEALGVLPGYYGKYAKCRELSYEEIEEKVKSGIPYVLRLRSPGTGEGKIIFDDMIKGKIEMPENIVDVVLLKTDGIPTYHFAHCCDDHFMRTTHVIRGDEWISSVPTHIQLFKSCGFKVPKYAHIAPIMKLDDGNKRKLSKRKDPEAAVEFYNEQGYPKESVLEYLYTLANSNFEDWRRANKDADLSQFPFNLKKMSVSGALFDLVKMNDVSKNVICVKDADWVLERTLKWAEEYDKDFFQLLSADKAKARAILNIDRENAKPRKDIAKWSDVPAYVAYFYNYEADYSVLPETINKEDAKAVLTEYKKVWNIDDDKDTWFQKMKDLCEPLGFTPNVKEYKANPDKFKGHIGDVSTIIRVAMTSRTNTPDLYEIMKILGVEEVNNRIDNMMATL
ncbi:MAG: glutamate--tRNA ligase [Oscillospiraceae bacterium]|nr:glutamate--tRNA ligase [Candidatus Limimonas coprohippi]